MPDLPDLSYEECRTILDATGVGKVAVSTPIGPRIFAVNYAVVGDSIVFRTTPWSTLGTYGPNSTLAFEVGQVSSDAQVSSSVVAVGRAHLVVDPVEIRLISEAQDPEPWRPAAGSTSYVTMPWSKLSGTRMRVHE